MTRILHFADLHLDEKTRENVTHAMGQILEVARRESPDLIVSAGDLAMRRGHLAPWVSEALRQFHCDLAEIAPVVVVAGNHDMTFRWGDAGTLRGALAVSERSDRIMLADRPEVFVVGDLVVACLPYPSKYALLAQRPDIAAHAVNAELSVLLEDAVRGLAVQAEQFPGRVILVYHGSIAGAKSSTEQSMTTEIDVVLSEAAIPAVFEAVLCGHIHKPQVIGRAVYSGSPCPLDFGEERHEHGVVLWNLDLAPDYIDRARFIPLEPAHRLITIDLRETPFEAFQNAAQDRFADVLKAQDLKGARVRVLAKAARGQDFGNLADQLRAMLTDEAGAHEVTVQVEREPEDRSVAAQVRADASLGSLLDRYAARNPDAQAMLPELQALGAEVDGALPPEAKALERVAEFSITATRWKAWKSLAGGEINWNSLGRLVVVEGENASGKSNLVEIESFALWGKLPRGKVALGELVHIGDREGWVEVEFTAAGETWTVRRSIVLNTAGVGASRLALTSVAGWGATPRNLGDLRETQAFIETLVGPYELYQATRFASQGDIDRLLNMTGAETKDTIQAALGAGIFEHREQAARDRLKALERDLEGIAREIGLLAPAAEETPQREAEVEAANTELFKATGVVVTSSELVQIDEKELGDARKLLAQATRAWEIHQERAGRARELEGRAGALAREREALEATVRAGQGAATLLLEHERRVAELAAHAEAEGALTAARERVRERTNAVDQARAARTREVMVEVDAVARATAEATKLETERVTMARRQDDAVAREAHAQEQEHKSLTLSLSDAREIAGKADVAPFGEKCVEAECALLRLPIEARLRIPELEEALLQADRNAVRGNLETQARHIEELAGQDRLLSNARLARSTAEARLYEARESARTALDVLEASVRAAQADVAALADRADVQAVAVLRGRVEEFNLLRGVQIDVTIKTGERAAGQLERLATELADLQQQAEALVAELKDAPPDPEAQRQAVEFAETALRQAKEDLEVAREDKASAQVELARREEALKTSRAAFEKLALKRQESDTARRRADVAGVFCRAMGRDGVPYLLLEGAVPALEEHANFFLGDGDLRVEIEPLRDLRSGDQKSEVVVKYRDRLGLHGLAAASGQQRTELGVALRFALAQIQAEAHGLRVSHVIIDEGLGVYADQINLLRSQQVPMRLADRFGRVFIISHLREIQELGDSRLRVCPNGATGAVVERVA